MRGSSGSSKPKKTGRKTERSVAVGRGHHGNCFMDISIFSATVENSAFPRCLTIGEAGRGATAGAFGNRLFCLCLKPAAGKTKKQQLKFLHVPFSHSWYKTLKGARKL